MLTQPLIFLDTNVILYFLGGRLVNPLLLGQYFISVITEIELLSYPSRVSASQTLLTNGFYERVELGRAAAKTETIY
ncbi:MAG: hypothetical protein V7K41_26865, partial [Nostoc sp.]